MCGICGIFDFSGAPIDRQLLRAMSDRIRHRGPDGEGHFVCDGVGLGSRRLSIIDLEHGGQPQSNEDGTIYVVFNGEIYNFVELREELIKKGHRFQTASDTEVIVHGYEEWGEECPRYFNGMFAFAIWDSVQRTLMLARDHLGVKPLYYVRVGDRLLFASEIKALLTERGCPREVDMQALAQLFTLRYVVSPSTLFRGIQKLPPAHRMIIDKNGCRVERFWTWRPEPRTVVNEASLIEEYQALVEESVRLQMRSDVPVGLFLSSGVDSGCLLALMSKISNQPVRTFTIGFEDGEAQNETGDARELAKMFGAEHSELMIGAADYERYYERYLWDLEEPVGNETAAAFHFVSHMTSKQVKVALTGQGADEPWGGYTRYLGIKLSELYSHLPQALTRGLLAKLGERWIKHEQLKRGLSALHEKDVLTRVVNVYSFFSPAMKARLFQPWVKDIISTNGVEAKDALRDLQEGVQSLDPLSQMLYLDTRTNLPDDLLMVGDKTSMASSLEVRVPFLDYRMIEFIETLPPHLKINGIKGKYLHKKALEKWLPDSVVYRKKKGFANPVDKWLRTSMRKFVSECLLSETSAVNKYFDRDYIQELVTKHEQNQEQHTRHIYLLLSFELWHQQFISL
jgi:asparagine synthase (glutamine-hydrolysing)